MDRNRLQALLDERRTGFSLPQAFYVDPDLFAADLEAVFEADWLFACNACEVKRPGDWLTLDIGATSVIVLRDREGEVRAFHNTCRHRGSRICLAEKGHSNRLVCPYHQWVYEVEVICGLVYVSLSENPPSLSRFRAAVTPFIAPHRPERTKVAVEQVTIEEANWKLVVENNRECYHCAANHPELLATFVEFPTPGERESPAQRAILDRAAAKWDAHGLPWRAAEGGDEFRCIRLPFHEGAVSFTTDGGPACRKLLGDLADPDLGSVRMFRAPNNWHHFLSDHILHARVLPLAANRTAVRTAWLVHEDAVEGVDYDPERLSAVWRATNEQDKRLAENNHRGVASKAYEPGPYAPTEFMLTHFTDWYARKLAVLAGEPAARLEAAE
jgi:glycine betaine catabolism A